MKSALRVLESLKKDILESAPDGVPTDALRNVLKDPPSLEDIPDSLYCGDFCDGVGRARKPMQCYAALNPANAESKIVWRISEETHWNHLYGHPRGSAIDMKVGGLSSMD